MGLAPAKAAKRNVDHGTRRFLLAAMVLIGFITFVGGDLTGNHPVRAAGALALGAAGVIAIVRGLLWRPGRRADSVVVIVRQDQPALYERAVRAFGSAQVLYDRRLGERRKGRSAPPIEQRQKERRQRADVDFEIKAFGSARVRL